MRVVHLPFTYYPDAIGGTEIYVQTLVQELGKLGCEGMIVAPSTEAAAYWHEGIRVYRLAVSPAGLGLRGLYGEGDPDVGAQFADLLDEEEVDVVHLHAFTSAISLRLVRESARRRIPVVFTYHTPTVSCQRGTLMRWGKAVCDGVMERRRCTQCTLQGLGLNGAASWTLGWLPPALAKRVGEAGWEGRFWTALRMSELVSLRHSVIRALWQEADAIVALCSWTEELLERNGVSPGKIVVSRHGLPRQIHGKELQNRPRTAGAPLRLVYMGRLDPTKGVDLLIRAVRALPGVAVELDLFGIVQDDRYRKQVAGLAAGDRRIRFLEPVENIRNTLQQYDVLVAPSQGMETGPLVVLEAFDAGVPILGSALGGIGDLVRHGVNGLLVRHWAEVSAWAANLRALAAEPRMVGRLAEGVRPPRGMDDVAKEMMAAYEGVPRLSAA